MPAFRLRLVDLGVLETVQENLENPRGVMTSIGALRKSQMQQVFRDQGHPKGSWPERMVPNVPGIIADLTTGPKPNGRRFEGRPALHDTGRLRGSVDFDVTGPRRVETGTAIQYAEVQHEGGESLSEPVTEQVQERLWGWLRTSSGAAWKNDLGWLLNKRYTGERISIQVRARPFADASPDQLDEVGDLLLEALETDGGVV